MVAVDLLDEEGNYDHKLRDRIIQDAFLRGLLLLGCGKAAIRFCPPLVINSEQIQSCFRYHLRYSKNALNFAQRQGSALGGFADLKQLPSQRRQRSWGFPLCPVFAPLIKIKD